MFTFTNPACNSVVKVVYRYQNFIRDAYLWPRLRFLRQVHRALALFSGVLPRGASRYFECALTAAAVFPSSNEPPRIRPATLFPLPSLSFFMSARRHQRRRKDARPSASDVRFWIVQRALWGKPFVGATKCVTFKNSVHAEHTLDGISWRYVIINVTASVSVRAPLGKTLSSSWTKELLQLHDFSAQWKRSEVKAR